MSWCEVAAIARKHESGLLAEPGDPGDLAQKILLLYNDRAVARHLAANARRAALEFDRPVQVRAYYELFHELANRGASSHARKTSTEKAQREQSVSIDSRMDQE